jgi:hypothetical protein
MIRSALLNAVLGALGSHPYLALDDFNIQEYPGKQTGEPCLRIVYRCNPNFYFRFHIPTSKSKGSGSGYEQYWFNCTMSPGRESVEETLNSEERRGLLSEIAQWLNRLYEDILSAPVVRQFEAHSSAIEELKQRLEDLPDDPISRDDLTEYSEALERVKLELTEQLKQQTIDKDELKQKVEELGRDI